MAKNNINLSVSDLGEQTKRIIKKFHIFIFFLVLAGGLGYALIILGSIVKGATAPSTTGDSLTEQYVFDEATLKKLNNLSLSNENKGLVLPQNQRVNPFE